MNIHTRDNLIQDAPDDDERNSLSALVLILPNAEKNGDDAVEVVMVGLGELFMQRARDYQQRHAQAVAEWDAWDDKHDKWSDDVHGAKLDELCDKYDLGSFAAFADARFQIVEVLQPSPV